MEYLKAWGVNAVSLAFIIAAVYPVLKGIIFKLRSRSMMETVKSMLTSVALLCSILLTFKVVKDFIIGDKLGVLAELSERVSIPLNLILTKSSFTLAMVHLIVFLIIFEAFKVLIAFMNNLVFRPLSDSMDRRLKEAGGGTRALLGGVFQIPKALCYIIILGALFNYGNLYINSDKLNNELNGSHIYQYVNNKVITPLVESDMAKSFPNLLEDSFKILDQQDNSNGNDEHVEGLVLYNGVTLEEGVKSNADIDARARSIGGEYNNNYDRAKGIYLWIGTNISYDDNKAVSVMQSDYLGNINSGAISAYETRSGVCFDYACLFTAMCRADNIPVRLIVGEGFNGSTWVSHSWNEVYVAEEDRWAPVDCTFYPAGNYFDNPGFNTEHRNRKIAGEWN